MYRSATRLFAPVALLALLLPACLPFGDSGDTKDETKGGGGVKLEDVYTATMALVASSQLTGLLDGEQGVSQDGAETIAGRIRDNLAKQSCLKVSGTGATVALDFGGGCALPNSPIPLQGKASATVAVGNTSSGSSLTLTLTLDEFGTGGKTATGGATLSMSEAKDGLDIDLATTMTAGEAAMTGGVHVDVLIDSATDKVTKTVTSTLPNTSVKSGSATLSVTATDVTLAAGDCYPSAGNILVTSAGLKATLAFSADTASTGVAQFTPPLSKKAEDKQLPGLGWKCN